MYASFTSISQTPFISKGQELVTTSSLLDFYVYSLHQVREVFHYFFVKVFNSFLSFFSFWHPHE